MSKREKRRETRPRQDSTTLRWDESTWQLTRQHMRIGWWSLLVFLTLGITLEAMHGFKFQWYVGDDNSTRRLMWTLAHAHGTLLSLINLAYAAAISKLGTSFQRFRMLSSWCLFLAGILLPGGFFAGGIVVYDGDPGLGILLVPVGGGLLFVAVILTAVAVERSPLLSNRTRENGVED